MKEEKFGAIKKVLFQSALTSIVYLLAMVTWDLFSTHVVQVKENLSSTLLFFVAILIVNIVIDLMIGRRKRRRK